jgi:predicted nucleotidyltransferase
MAAVITKKDALERIARCSRQLQQFGIHTIGIFGSFSRDEVNEQSDIDLLVEFDADKKTFNNFIETCFLLEEILGRKVELVTEESLSPYLKPYIMKELEYVPLSD